MRRYKNQNRYLAMKKSYTVNKTKQGTYVLDYSDTFGARIRRRFNTQDEAVEYGEEHAKIDHTFQLTDNKETARFKIKMKDKIRDLLEKKQRGVL